MDSFAIHPIKTVEEFRNLFSESLSSKIGIKLLVCYDDADDGVTLVCCEQLLSSVLERCPSFPERLQGLFTWNCTGHLEAQDQIGKTHGRALMLVLEDGKVADSFTCNSLSSVTSIPLIDSEVLHLLGRRLCCAPSRIPLHLPEQTQSPITVNIASLLEVGCRCMRLGKAVYAEKIFRKALGVLDSVLNEVCSLNDPNAQIDYFPSLALTLAWLGMSELVQGKGIPTCDAIDRLTRMTILKPWVEQPLTDVARAVALKQLLMAGAPWNGNDPKCSQKHLSQHLRIHPEDSLSRRMLIVTLFLAGDLERCLTETLKAQSIDTSFGSTALDVICQYCGADHPLVLALNGNTKK